MEEGGGWRKGGKKTAGFSRGSQSVECLMKFLEEVPRPLEYKTQNHSVLGRRRKQAEEADSETLKKKKRGTKIKKVGPELFGPELR